MKTICLVLTLVAFVAAKECQKFCPAIYNPVCGYNGFETKNFANQCEMDYANCADSAMWVSVDNLECFQERRDPRECLKVCPPYYKPVCGFDGDRYAAFDNMCKFEVINCIENFVWEISGDDTC